MFEVGQYIVHENKGVCRVEAIGPLESNRTHADKLYYTLLQCCTNGSKVFTPVDSTKILMRHVMSSDEASALLEEIAGIGCLCINEDKLRENDYKAAIEKCDCRELVSVIKSIYFRMKERAKLSKKIAAVDEKYYKIALDRLCGEISVVLGIDKENVKEHIIEIMETDDE